MVQRAYDLTLWLIRKVETFPRSFRFSLGDRIVARSLDVVEALNAASWTGDKRAFLERAHRDINGLRILLRMAVDLKLLTSDSQEFAAGRVEEIGRMTAGWRKSLK